MARTGRQQRRQWGVLATALLVLCRCAPWGGDAGVDAAPVDDGPMVDLQDEAAPRQGIPQYDDGFVVVFLPDTQKYADGHPDRFYEQIQWIVDNVEAQNIAFVSHLGDIVDNGPDLDQWAVARGAMDLLDQAGVPYGTCLGNHDQQNSTEEWAYGPDTDTSCSSFETDIDCDAVDYLDNFGPQLYADEPWYGGASPSGHSNYQIIHGAGRKFLFLHLAVDPRAAELAWAQTVLDEHDDAIVHLSTHRYLYDFRITEDFLPPINLLRAGRFNVVIHLLQKALYFHDSITADELFHDFIAVNTHIFMVHCGHVDAEYHQESLNEAGLPVYEILVNFQTFSEQGGAGWMRLVQFDLEAGRVHVRTWSPWTQTFRNNGDGFEASVESLQKYFKKYSDDLADLGLDPEEYAALVDYYSTTEEGRLEYFEMLYSDGSRDSEFTLEIDFDAYPNRRDGARPF